MKTKEMLEALRRVYLHQNRMEQGLKDRLMENRAGEVQNLRRIRNRFKGELPILRRNMNRWPQGSFFYRDFTEDVSYCERAIASLTEMADMLEAGAELREVVPSREYHG